MAEVNLDIHGAKTRWYSTKELKPVKRKAKK
jgi:hypothetical protein